MSLSESTPPTRTTVRAQDPVTPSERSPSFPSSSLRSPSLRSHRSTSSHRLSGLFTTAPGTAAAPKLDLQTALTGTLGQTQEDSLSPLPPHRSPAAPERRRVASSQSLTAADAAKLATKLRATKASVDDRTTVRGSSFGSSLHSPGLPSGGSPARLPAWRPDKAVVSRFETKGSDLPEPVPVESNTEGEGEGEGNPSDGSRQMRYSLPYALVGPPLSPHPLNDALLAPAFTELDPSWAALQAAGAGPGSKAAAAALGHRQTLDGGEAGALIGASSSPTPMPLHFIHALTTTSKDAFPLDPEYDASPEGTPSDGASEEEVEEDEVESPTTPTASMPDGVGGVSSQAGKTKWQYLKPPHVRVLAVTAAALGQARSHRMTRRYADPQKQSFQRLAAAKGLWTKRGEGGGGGAKTPRWSVGPSDGYRLASSLYGAGGVRRSPSDVSPPPGSSSGVLRPPLHRTRSLASADLPTQRERTPSGTGGFAAGLAEVVEQQAATLKRVWSGGGSAGKGGLSSLSRMTDTRR